MGCRTNCYIIERRYNYNPERVREAFMLVLNAKTDSQVAQEKLNKENSIDKEDKNEAFKKIK